MNREAPAKSPAAPAARPQPTSASASGQGAVQLKQALVGQPFAAQEEMLAPSGGRTSTNDDPNVQRKLVDADGKSSPEADEQRLKGKQYDTAKARHQTNLTTLAAILKNGAAEAGTKFGSAWPNACQWIQAGKTQLHVLTQTHDARERAKALGHPGEVAMFGMATPVPTSSDYAWDDPSDKTNIECDDLDTVGLHKHGPSRIAIIEPSTRAAEDIKETIVHEVQHDADDHGSGDFDRYTSEFCSYWVDQGYAGKSATTGSADEGKKTDDGTELKGFDNARQQAIFRHVHNGYPYVAKAWKDSATFRKKVLALTKPEGVNLVDSPRIDDLRRELTMMFVSVKESKAALAKLNDADKEAIRSEGMRKHWLALLENGLDGEDLTFFKKALGLS